MAIAQVNSVAVFAGAASGTIAATATSLTSGNLLIVGIRTATATTVSGVTDTAGNSYTRAATVSSGACHEIWYTQSTAGNAANVVTAAFVNASSTNRAIATVQYSGASGYLPRRVTAWGNTIAVSITLSLTYTLTDGIAICYAAGTAGSAFTAGTGYTTAVADSANVNMIEDAIIASSTTLTPSVSTAVSNTKVIVATFFEPAPAAGGSGGSYAFVG